MHRASSSLHSYALKSKVCSAMYHQLNQYGGLIKLKFTYGGDCNGGANTQLGVQQHAGVFKAWTTNTAAELLHQTQLGNQIICAPAKMTATTAEQRDKVRPKCTF